MQKTADHLNTLGHFCGMRDVPALTQTELKNTYGITQADIMVLFGGSILAGADVLAQAMQHDIAKKYVIVGGAGHTTDTLRKQIRAVIPSPDTTHMPEAELFAAYLKHRYQLTPDLLECASTNCGNNITYLLDLLNHEHLPFHSIILTQDATMQRRMDAGLRKYVAPDVRIINYAAYQEEVIVRDNELAFRHAISGMWDMERYITLLMGEIPRLTDDENGYGPNGHDYIAHVTVPETVTDAFRELKKTYASLIRQANPQFASPK